MLSLQRTAYKCDLYVVKDNADIFIDRSKKLNIAIAHKNKETESMMTVIAQPTMNPFYFREIITGKLIPVYRINYDDYDMAHYYYGTRSPYFVTCAYNDGFISRYHNNVAKTEEINDYVKGIISSRQNYDAFKQIIDAVAQIAKDNYKKALSQNKITEAGAAKRLVKEVKKAARIKAFE